MAKVSVILPVYNGEEYLQAAIDSILAQTFRDFELIIINDGSRDGSKSIIDAICDERVRKYHQDNVGLAATLNRGIDLAQGDYVARQDQDDISYPERLERQVDYLDNRSDVALVGTRAEIWVGDKKTERVHNHPTRCADLKFDLLFDNPFVHSSVMFRKETVRSLGGYTTDPARQPPEDYELWSRVSRVACIGNIGELLVAYREVPKSMSRVSVNPFLEKVLMISSENLAWQTGLSVDNPDLRETAILMHGVPQLLSKRVDIKSICRLIASAAKNIENEVPDADLTQQVRHRCAVVRYQYYSSRRYTRFLRPLISVARKGKAFVKRLIGSSERRSSLL